ncbi:hypothetical protein [Microcoleus sp. Pol12B4]|uniref:hypothetical protein n=1 Tax=Microcoleus sp. Pol12B4 TaxID=3055395 RepID=UPI002FD2AACB
MPDVRAKLTALPPRGVIANMQHTDYESHRKYDRPSHPKNRTMVKGDRTSPKCLIRSHFFLFFLQKLGQVADFSNSSAFICVHLRLKTPLNSLTKSLMSQ